MGQVSDKPPLKIFICNCNNSIDFLTEVVNKVTNATILGVSPEIFLEKSALFRRNPGVNGRFFILSYSKYFGPFTSLTLIPIPLTSP